MISQSSVRNFLQFGIPRQFFVFFCSYIAFTDCCFHYLFPGFCITRLKVAAANGSATPALITLHKITGLILSNKESWHKSCWYYKLCKYHGDMAKRLNGRWLLSTWILFQTVKKQLGHCQLPAKEGSTDDNGWSSSFHSFNLAYGILFFFSLLHNFTKAPDEGTKTQNCKCSKRKMYWLKHLLLQLAHPNSFICCSLFRPSRERCTAATKPIQIGRRIFSSL